MNGFAKHGLQHSSASAINMWCDAPHMWVAQYLLNKRGTFSAAAKSGVLVEEAVVNVLARGWTGADAIKSAVDEYNKFTALSCTDSERKRGAGIPEMIELTLATLAPYGTPEFDRDLMGNIKQKKIELTCNGDGWTLPIIGYIDFHYPSKGVVIDLKTTMKMPGEMSDPHKRQACIYQKAFNNQAVSFLYVTPKKVQMFDCGDTGDMLGQVKTILNRQEKFLSCGDADKLREIVPVNTSSYYNDAAITKELFGI